MVIISSMSILKSLLSTGFRFKCKRNDSKNDFKNISRYDSNEDSHVYTFGLKDKICVDAKEQEKELSTMKSISDKFVHLHNVSWLKQRTNLTEIDP